MIVLDHIYCYPNSNVLINKLNIRDNHKLYEIERQITGVKIASLISFVSKKNKDNIFIMASVKDKDTVQKIIQSPPEIKKGRKR